MNRVQDIMDALWSMMDGEDKRQFERWAERKGVLLGKCGECGTELVCAECSKQENTWNPHKV